MLKLLNQSAFLKNFRSVIDLKPSVCFELLSTTAKAFLISDLIKTKNYSIVLITGHERNDQLLEDLKFFLKKDPLEFPAWETLPSEDIKPSSDIIGKRFHILHELSQCSEEKLVITSLQGVLQKISSKQDIMQRFVRWEKHATVHFNHIEKLLVDLGYEKRAVTTDKGEFSIRGGILDVFPVSSYSPYRLDFFGDEITEIKTFDPISQKSVEKQTSLFISAADELQCLEGSSKIETLLSYFNKPPLVIFDDILAIEDRYLALKKLTQQKHSYFMSLDELFEEIDSSKTLYFAEDTFETLFQNLLIQKKTPLNSSEPQEISFHLCNKKISSFRLTHPFIKIEDMYHYDMPCASHMEYLLKAIHSQQDLPLKVVFLTSNSTEETVLKESIKQYDMSTDSFFFEKGYLSHGFVMLDINIAVIPFPEFSKRYKVRRQKWRVSYHTPASDFHEIQEGDLVVHFQNGIARYLGIEKQKNHLGVVEEFLILEYAKASKLYVPLSQSHLVSRYIGSHEEHPSLNVLGTTKWQMAKAKAQKSIIGYAKDLLHWQAERQAIGGFNFPPDSEDMLLFEEEFPFVETDDQLRAISEIKKDMQSKNAMDRLVCGDVGYGKTEVAMRAAFKAVTDGKKQVAVLVPTTTLAMQHFETFSERMANFAINVKVLSRFIKARETKKIIEDTHQGLVDVLIGTHRLISKDISFKNLGLIIIDEEQRFGVRAKESLKKLKTGVDCLTLSATPIPRTLYMSVVGARDLSVINTPPHDRLPIKTIIAESCHDMTKNAILRELARDGQIYFIHNRVESIYKIKQELEQLVPSATIKVAHGQQSPDEIDEAFHSFKSGTTQILLATTLVESGIDIPNANTILIDRAHTFGLADLYQLRGRVGRWNRPAYCYFLVPSKKILSEISQKRLNALAQISGFGGGMKLALRDLEIRGAGDILGTQQSGHVSTIGFHLYCKMLKKAVSSLKSHCDISFIETKIESSFPGFIPETYISETSLRLEIYHRLGDASSENEIKTILEELKDRFGTVPQEIYWLTSLADIKLFAGKNYFTFLKYEKNSLQAHQQKGETLIKKTLPLPSIKTPLDLKEFTKLSLTQNFKIK